MTTPSDRHAGSLQGGVRPDLLAVDETPAVVAAVASAVQVTATWTDAAAANPGLGALMDVADDRSGNNLRLTGHPDAPRVGEGQTLAAPDAPAQSGGRPSYAAPVVGDEDPFLG